MAKNFKQKLFNATIFLLCIIILIAAPFMMSKTNKKISSETPNMLVLDIWQIDSFEGGKGSRANYLKDIGKEFTESTGHYINVVSLTSASARKNLESGIIPDMISYGAGMYGLESYISSSQPYYTWCNGGYCILSLDTYTEFNDISESNTIINRGTENFVDIATMFCNLNKATRAAPTSSYTKLINGEYKYLFGTQRDIFRLITRGVQFAIKPVTAFNDLYQNISITSQSEINREQCSKFIDLLLNNGNNINKIGLFYNGVNLYDNELSCMQNLQYDYYIKSPISKNIKQDIETAIKNNDLKKLKVLLK